MGGANHMILLLLFGTVVWTIKADSMNPMPEIIEVDHLFQIGDKSVDLQGKDKVILLVGGTGTGKSTLSMFMRHDANLKITLNKAEDIVFTDGEARIGNENTLLSKTLIPHVDVDAESGALVVDCAGFGDTRHPVNDILASFFTQKVFDSAKSLKIVVVETFERLRLGMDRSGFIPTLTHLARILDDQVGDFNGSVALVATKAESTWSDEKLMRSVNVFLQETGESLLKKQKDAEARGEEARAEELRRQILLVNMMVDRVAIFRRPDDDLHTDPWFLPALKKNFEDIRNLVFENLNYAPTDDHVYQVSVAAETIIYIKNDLLPAAEENLKEYFADVGRQLILDFDNNIDKTSQFLSEQLFGAWNYAKNYSADLEGIDSNENMLDHCRKSNVNESLILALSLEVRKTEFLYSVSSARGLQNEVSSLFSDWEVLVNHVNQTVQFLNFAVALYEKSGDYQMHSNKPFDYEITAENFADFLYHLRQCEVDTSTIAFFQPNKKQLDLINRIKLEKMISEVKIESEENVKIYSGHYILSSRIEHPERIEGNLLILATQKFFIDSDLNLTDCHLTIVTPLVEVVGAHRTITTKGSTGERFTSAALEGAMGENGDSGYSSGDVNVYALDVKNANALRIRSLGGDGADGQDGGNGRNGRASEAPSFPYGLHGKYSSVERELERRGYTNDRAMWRVTSHSKKYLILMVYNKLTHIKQFEFEVKNAQGAMKPTSGGDGGDGGEGAPPGDLNLMLKRSDTRVATAATGGKNGAGGRGGLKGTAVPTCAITKFLCQVALKEHLVLFFTVSEDDLSDSEIHCIQTSQYYCHSYFVAEKNGKYGRFARGSTMQMYKYQLFEVKESVWKFYNASVKSAAQEKSGYLQEFMQYILTNFGQEEKAVTQEYHLPIY